MAEGAGPLMALPAMDNTIGAFMIGTFAAVFMGGVTSTQCYTYYSHYHATDKTIWKAIVYCLFVVDNFHSFICIWTVYLWTVTHYANPLVLDTVPWSFYIEPPMTGIVTFVCQAFFAYRVYIVSGRKRVIPSLIMILSLIQMSFSISCMAAVFRLESKFSLLYNYVWGVTVWLITASVADVLITGSLVWYLRKAVKGDFQRSHTLIDRIIRNTIETNGLTMIVAIVDAVLFYTMPLIGWHSIPQFLLVKLYFNSLLVSLNSRQSIAAAHRAKQLESTYKSPIATNGQFTGTGSTCVGSQFAKPGLAVQVTTHTLTRTHSLDDIEKVDMTSSDYTLDKEQTGEQIQLQPARKQDSIPVSWA